MIGTLFQAGAPTLGNYNRFTPSPMQLSLNSGPGPRKVQFNAPGFAEVQHLRFDGCNWHCVGSY
jgi:hypothetical protein